jgi:fatty acid desaturase
MSSANRLTPDHLRRIRAQLPDAAFRLDPWKLGPIFAHAGVVILAHAAVAPLGFSLWLVVPILSAAASLSCLAFATHDLAHGSVLRPGRVRRVVERFGWGLLLIPATVWHRVHNQAHHGNTNTAADPDRPFFTGEATVVTRWYARLFYPNDEVFPWNPLVFVHFMPYIVRNTVAGLLPARWKPAIVPVRAPYLPGEEAAIVGDLVLIAAQQAALFLLTGGRLGPYLIMAVGTQVVTSCITMSYLFTNHFLNPVGEEPDPIRGTTSVIVPKWVDRVHAHFSFHTEHHLFPALNSNYYPHLSRILAEMFPETYQRIPMREAWRRLWQIRTFVAQPAKAVTS